jgi:HD-GYP domain-containing protein (c-di-GMP phosphodiesterase class II)
MMIAKEMNLDATFMETLQISAQLHDVGKIGIEDRILRKPGALTAEEFEVMKTHTTKGANILRPVMQLAEMLPGIELHHEALDGRGYPYGLQGDEIPLLARVIAVADTFDALTTNRPYQTAHTPDEALKIIQNLAGKRLDPTAVAALLAVYGRGEIRIQRFSIKKPAPAATRTTDARADTSALAAAETASLERSPV